MSRGLWSDVGRWGDSVGERACRGGEGATGANQHRGTAGVGMNHGKYCAGGIFFGEPPNLCHCPGMGGEDNPKKDRKKRKKKRKKTQIAQNFF